MALAKFVDPLPVPAVLKPKGYLACATYYEVRMRQVKQKLHRDLPETTVWAYEGVYPGPTFEVLRHEGVKVKWLNDLPDEHLLPVDRTVHGAHPPNPLVRTVVHLHGGEVPAYSDGHPEAWFTRDFRKVGPHFRSTVYFYPNIQRPATLWYHDHALGITRLNVYAGLAGFYLIRDAFELGLNLPGGRFEIPLVIQDRSFNADGSLFYPRQPDPPVPGVDPSIVPEFFGDTILVNGKVWPYLEVEPRKYRFRLLNGSNSRFYLLSLTSGQPLIQIGTDGGLLEAPVPVAELTLAPGERADVVVDFSAFAGETIRLVNGAAAPFPGGDPPTEDTSQVMEFRVTLPLSEPDTSTVPSSLRPIWWLSPAAAALTRDLALVEAQDPFGRLLLLLDGKRWSAPVSEKPRLGSVEVWRLINLTEDAHPIHLHLVQFQILGRRPFDVDRYRSRRELVFTGPPVPPDPNERGLKDTVRANPGQVTSIIARFGAFAGPYVWHCHILEHEDHEMMRPYEVVPVPLCTKFGPVPPGPAMRATPQRQFLNETCEVPDA